ncbi:uncharacterized protein [Chelonus insularis]|uniref:uncharacterized protein n=1 Tax=Chelonus insularis TaxID=460826 RepID=UPI00158DC321|nr:uncharacterized protein LOC118071729 [Chelonus insularis]
MMRILDRKSSHKSYYQGLILLWILLINISGISSYQLRSRKNAHVMSPRSAMRLPAVERARNLSCIDPQPRAYHLKDLMENYGLLHPKESPDQPAYLVVRRCDGQSGCCSSPDLVCMPEANTIYFEELEIQLWSVETKKPIRKIISVEQHSTCSCEPANQTERENLERRRPKISLVRS